MKFGSLFTGVGGFDLGFERAGFECAWQVEQDAHCLEVLAEHFPNVERHTDVRTVGRHNLEPVDLICGGFPCQDLSVAGKRAGFDGERSSLWFEYARIIDELQPQWVVIENVPGLLSSKKGRDFGFILNALDERGYGVAWRVLDSQNFGVAQRRRRVFIVGGLGNGGAAEILFESNGVRWDIEKGRKTGEGTAGTVEDGSTLGFDLAQITSKANYSNPKRGDPQPPLNTLGQGFVAYENHPADSRITETGDISQQLTSRMGTGGGNVPLVQMVTAPTLTSSNDPSRSPQSTEITQQVEAVLRASSGVRRLTPTECERLQGFPDGWTGSQSDTQRYKQMGNAVTVNVIEWIADRILGEKK